MTDKYIFIENGVVTNVIHGASDGYVHAVGDLADAQMGDTIVNGKIIPPADTRTYAEKRQQTYKSIPEQLDMIYWDRVNGTNHWQNHIATVKQQYPKS